MLDKVKVIEAPDRVDGDDGLDSTEALPSSTRLPLLRRFAPQRLTSRIVLLNLAGLATLLAGMFYFNQYREGLIDARVQSLTTQAHIISAAIAGSATVDTGSIVIDPDALSEQDDELTTDAEQLTALDFPIDPELAGPVLKSMLANTTVRARIIDQDGNLVVDSRFLYGRSDIVQADLPPLNDEQRLLDRIWTTVANWILPSKYPVQIEYGLDNGKDFPEVVAA